MVLQMVALMVYGGEAAACTVSPMEKRPEVVSTGLEDLRKQLGAFIRAATAGKHTIVRRHGKPIVVLVPVDWYVEHGGDVGPVTVKKPDEEP